MTSGIIYPSRSWGITCLSKDTKARKYSACGLIHGPYSKVKIWQPSHTINMINLGFELNYSYMSHFHCHRLSSRLTDEIRDIFTALGSTMVKSLKPRDSWVFAGTYGMKKASPFEKVGTSCSFKCNCLPLCITINAILIAFTNWARSYFLW